ncbi:MAG: FAD-dependent protein [Ginsengibacter sp.]
MQKQLTLKLTPSQVADSSSLKIAIAASIGCHPSEISGFQILKKSLDARSKTVSFQIELLAFAREPFHQRELQQFYFQNVASSQKKVIIIGAGPAGLFAALRLLESGIKPVILERGKDVRARRRDLALLNKNGIINPESNYCFGEGGAGTYSDGKLYTRSSKRGNIARILNLFVHFGAEENILYEAHPHIGTNKLPNIITSMRSRITECGGEFYFDKKVTDFISKNGKIVAVKTGDGELFSADAFVLATGHSARDIFNLFHDKKLLIEAKPFSLGVRIEHPQSSIDEMQYGAANMHLMEEGLLPPASYSLVAQANGRGVFSFCMCPGGIIAPAATNPGEVVVNGWSPSKRDNPYANSGIVVQVEIEDALNYFKSNAGAYRPMEDDSPLLMMHFQQEVEQRAFQTGGGKFVAPAQRMVDFTEGKHSTTLPKCSYIPGINSIELKEVLPLFVSERLQIAFKAFAKKMPARGGSSGYFTHEAVLVATESRTSSPVRIPRTEKLCHPQLGNLYPCGEGAGYAGGIVSAAMDGERVASTIVGSLHRI